MPNNIKKFSSTSLLGIPFVGVLLLLGVVASRPQPVLSNQLAYIESSTASATDSQLPTYTWLQKNPYPTSEFIGDKEVRLRRVLAKSVTASTGVPHSNDLEAVSTTKAKVSELQAPTKTARATSTRALFPRQDGVYLYGQSPKSGQLGQGYIIFEKQQGKVMGALYMPSSEFSCFNGTLHASGQLAMTVIGYPGDKSSTQVATNNTLPQIMDDQSSTYAHSVTLQDYYPLNNIRADDRRILQMCQANVQE
ncbi:MAG: hypothetical protein HC862_04795 [Scytonema sp. RU_4_4]|nr:hypothetical protein [Scytonema sp. RU_4_4]NJR73095.1 hypothetical protein [Scytonema sp. CRU_2_7]